MEHTPILPPEIRSEAISASPLLDSRQPADAPSGPSTAILPMATDAVIVPRAVLAQIAEALAAIVQVSGEGFSMLIDRLDQHDGEPDAEDDDPAEATGDEQDAAYVEWTTTRGSQKRGPNILAGQEDDEEDDPAEDDDPAGQCDEDGINTGGGWFGQLGPGCELSDTGIGDSGGLHG